MDKISVSNFLEICSENTDIFLLLLDQAEKAVKQIEDNKKKRNPNLFSKVTINENVLKVTLGELEKLEIISYDFGDGLSHQEVIFELLEFLFLEKFFEDTQELQLTVGSLLEKYYRLTKKSPKTIISDTISFYLSALNNAKFHGYKKYMYHWIEYEFPVINEIKNYGEKEKNKIKQLLNFLFSEEIISGSQYKNYVEGLKNPLRKFDVIKDLFLKKFFADDSDLEEYIQGELAKYYDEIKEYSIPEDYEEEDKENRTRFMSIEICHILKGGISLSQGGYIEDYLNHLLSEEILTRDEILSFHELTEEAKDSSEQVISIYKEYLCEWLFKVMHMAYFDEDPSELIYVGKTLLLYYKGNENRITDILAYCTANNVNLPTQ